MTDRTDRPAPAVTAAEVDEIKRLRDIVVRGLGDSDWELVEIRAGDHDEMRGVFRKKRK